MDAFVRCILDSKLSDGFPNDQVEITLISHSLGGAVSMMYLVEKLRRNHPHFIHKLLLLSPAGYHSNIPVFCKVTGPVIYRTMSNWISGVRFPSGIIVFLLAKIIQDLRNLPAVRDLVSYLYTRLLIGGPVENSAFSQVNNFTFNLLLGGTSSKVFKHFWQMYVSGKFQMYDFGDAKNRELYGKEFSRPPDMHSFFQLIDIPVHFLCGELDLLIPPSDVFVHFTTLRSHSPDLATFVCFKDANHINFTYGQDEHIISYVRYQLTGDGHFEDSEDDEDF